MQQQSLYDIPPGTKVEATAGYRGISTGQERCDRSWILQFYRMLDRNFALLWLPKFPACH